ncbi:MAG: LCP family protein [bacterium]
MQDQYINFLNEDELFKKRCKKKKILKLGFTLIVILSTIVTIYSLNALLINSSAAKDIHDENSSSFIHRLLSPFKKFNILDQIGDLIELNKKHLNGEENDRVNFLILGIGGKGHEAGELTDTIIIASLKPSTMDAGLISIPRDLLVPINGYGWFKINSANAFGEQKEKGAGIKLAKETVENITGQKINYHIKVDFSGFEKIIDILGEVCLNVENDLIDYQYPIQGKENDYPISSRYEYLHIEKGWRCMDGALSLKYARSRHAVGIEGSDFARAKRQQKLLGALKDKAISYKTFLNPQKIIQILDNLNDNIKTDLSVSEIAHLLKLSKNIDINKIAMKVLDNNPEGYLIDYYGDNGNGAKMYALTTRSGDFSEIKKVSEDIFIEAQIKGITTAASDEMAKIEILNGTKITGWANQVSLELKNADLNIIKIGNAAEQDRKTTIIYSQTHDNFVHTLNMLEKKLNAVVAYTLPEWLKEESATADIIIVLGKE